MSQVKGLVLLSRFDYLEKKEGPAVLREFLIKISTDETNFTRQPVDGANLYPAGLLGKVDQLLLEEHFNQNELEFRQLGEWNAQNLLDRFFNLYKEEQKPVEMLNQYARLRELLIGSGTMTVHVKDKTKISVAIDYGQTIPKSVCLSEQGFVAASLKLCGAGDVQIDETECASEAESSVCKFEITFV